MFLPRYQIISEFLRPALDQPTQEDMVVLPRDLFHYMLYLLLSTVSFDEEDYLRRNPDVAIAVNAGSIPDARSHFLTKGYYEGRVGGCPAVDEAWYLQANPDVAAAIHDGHVASAHDHFAIEGADGWRCPSREAFAPLAAWRALIDRAGRTGGDGVTRSDTGTDSSRFSTRPADQ
jgi:hypothetical protein